MIQAVLILTLSLIPLTAGAEPLDATAREGVAHYNSEEFEQASNRNRGMINTGRQRRIVKSTSTWRGYTQDT